ncbi:ArsR family transcriptional regulator [Natrinema gelatinilyticum]|uniref:ArsR family transcriptional regulator n=1 Tax=Natrinema gelatinilyticum TaxID=2961571 RepID=UPI0020C31B41|nr:ArsR family transcriptional regulator [Natrinema gelatinilyticum]
MGEETTPPPDNLSLDGALDVLADKYRRRLLIALLEHNPQGYDAQRAVDISTENGEEKDRKIAIDHAHLPKLEAADLIERNRNENVIRKGPRFEEIEPLLELMHDHADELPDGWID